MLSDIASFIVTFGLNQCYFILNILYDDSILYIYDDGIFTEVEILQDYFLGR